jgi:ABC-2 type transport system permease protein
VNIRKLLAVAATDLRLSHTRPSVILFRLVIPIVLIVVIGFANGAFEGPGGSVPTVAIDLYDRDRSELSGALIQRLRDVQSRFEIHVVAAPEEAGAAGDTGTPEANAMKIDTGRVVEGRVAAAVVLPAGLSASLREGEAAEIRLLSDDLQSETITNLSHVLSTAAQEVAAIAFTERWARSIYAEIPGAAPGPHGAAARDAARAIWNQGPLVIETETVQPRSPVRTVREWGGGFQQSVPGMGSMYVMFAVLAGVGTLVWERKNWTLQRLMAMPLRKGEFIGGKILSRMTVGVIEFIIAFAAGAVIAAATSVSFGGAPMAIALVALAFSFMTSALALLVATLVRTIQQASGVTTLLALTLAPIGGAWWSLDLEFIPEFMRQIAVISPFYWAMEGFKAVIMYGGGLQDVLVHVAVLAALGVVLFGAAIARFRTT